MTEATTVENVDGRDVAKVIADRGPLTEGQFVCELMDRHDCSSSDALSLIRHALMQGRLFTDDDEKYCRTGYWDEPGWDPGGG